MNIYRELKERRFVYQETDSAAIEKLLTSEKITYYVGFDPTGSSLHVGHLLPIMAMRLLQKAGHKPIALVGGATGQIGDPSGKIVARPIITKDTVAENAAALKAQLSRFISTDGGEGYFVNNADWLCDMNFLDFLRDVGSKFSINRMLAQESVKSRLEDGLTFLEFSYSLLQAYDFTVLNKKYGCKMQFGGQDQWGNMVAGVDLVRKLNGEEVFSMTFPLLLDTNGQKFGKTAGGFTVWLDKNRTSVFDYYQFWRNCEDIQLEQLLLNFTTLPTDEIRMLVQEGGNVNRAKEILAYEATSLAHGADEAAQAYLSAGAKFGFADPKKLVKTSSAITALDTDDAADQALPTVELPRDTFEGDGFWIVELFTASGLTKSNGDARRLIQGGGAYINDQRVTDMNMMVTTTNFSDGSLILKAGKKSFKRIVLN